MYYSKHSSKYKEHYYFIVFALKPGGLFLFDSGESAFSGLRRFTLRSNF